MRPLSACIACRDRRKRCDRPRRGTSCKFCIRRGLRCTVEESAAVRPPPGDGYEPLVSARGEGTHPISSTLLVPEQEVCNELVDLYFRYIHVTFHNLFHRPSFEVQVRDGSIPKVLLFGVFALAARFSSHSSFANIDPKERGLPYAKECERLLDLHKTCLTTIQACVLLGAIQVVEMDSATESVFYTIGCRMAMILDLPHAPAKTRIEQEVNLRVWWSVVATDTWSSAGLGLPRAIQPRYDIPLPMDERVFLPLTPTDPPVSAQQGADLRFHPRPELSTSLIAQMIKLNGILNEINALIAKAATEDLDPVQVQLSPVEELAAALDSWRSELPADMEYTTDNLQYWANHDCGPSFVVLHLNFHHAGQLLFYRFLHSSLTPDASPITTPDITTSISAHYAARCQSHAAHLSNIMHAASSHHDVDNTTTTTTTTNPAAVSPTPNAAPSRIRPENKVDILYPLAGHMLVVASTVHTHTLLFSTSDAAIALARARLERSFAIISRMARYWPALRASSGRLAAFHAACLAGRRPSLGAAAAVGNGNGIAADATTTRSGVEGDDCGGGGQGDRNGAGDAGGGGGEATFRLDRWMLKFLVDFAKPVDGWEGG